MSTVHAMENALGVTVTGPLRDLRRLLYCGEWIESHTLHIYMLHARHCQRKILNTWSGHRTAQIDPEKCRKINDHEIGF